MKAVRKKLPTISHRVKLSSKRTPCASPRVILWKGDFPASPRVKRSSKRTPCASPCILIVTILLAFIFITPSLQARKIKTKHSIPKTTEKPSNANTSESSDSIISLSSDSITFVVKILPAIRFYGFDKTVSSNLESFFISNNLDSNIQEMEIEITYFDMKGRQLHKRNVKIDCNLPAGETVRTDIKSWDTQKSFYFHQSAKPRRQSTPFDVKLRLLSLTLQPSL